MLIAVQFRQQDHVLRPISDARVLEQSRISASIEHVLVYIRSMKM